MNKENLLILASYITISSYRLKVLKSLDDEVKTPTTISKDSNLRTNHVSTVLTQLKEKNIIECINKDVRKGKLYKTTDLGRKVLDCIKKGEIK